MTEQGDWDSSDFLWASMDDFKDEPVAEVESTDVALHSNDDAYDTQARKAEADRLEQANDLREKFFWFAVIAAAICTMASVATVVTLAATGSGSEPIYVAFISGLSVEALGITAIMARYLFSHPSSGKEPD